MKIYFIGICGTATGNVAILMKRLGHDVCGSDTGMYEPMKSALANAQVKAEEGWNPERLDLFAPDLVVVGNAISRMNPELEFVLSTQKYEYTSLPDLIGKNLIGKRKCLVVSGTHGKTTTTTLAAYLLRSNGIDAGWIIGGIPKDLKEGGCNLGDIAGNAPFVIEGDEYDTAFFDKRSKFLHYRPYALLINNIEFDHADIFRDIIDVKRTFSHVRRIVSPNGLIIENADDSNIASLEDTPWTSRMSVGFSDSANLKISDFVQSGDTSEFTLTCAGKSKCVSWCMQGDFNARNAAMAIAGVAKILGLENPLDLNIESLKDFGGVKRRQEILFDSPKLKVVEDFGHHPTAIRLTLTSLKQKYPDWKLIACFEPRSNTAKRNVFQDDFADALNLADKALIGAANTAKVAETERMNTSALAEKYSEKMKAYQTNLALLDDLKKYVESSEEKLICVFFSNGSFDNIQHILGH